MSVGGRIIEMKPMTITAGHYPGKSMEVVRLWCLDSRHGDEIAVYAEPAEIMPKLGDEIWWQSGRIYFDGDKRSLRKIGFSFRPPGQGGPQ